VNRLTTSPNAATTRPSSTTRSFRPWWRWMLTALAFPPAGLIAHLIAGPVDDVPAAVLGGAIAGAGIGAAQWALLRHRNVGTSWIPASAAGIAAGLAVGSAVVDYRTDITSLAVMGAFSGLGMGFAQGVTLRNPARAIRWAGATAALWALGWVITTAGGIDVDEQWVNFGLYGCLTATFVQSTFIGAFIPAGTDTKKVTS
jgi:hypothetical protein